MNRYRSISTAMDLYTAPCNPEARPFLSENADRIPGFEIYLV